MHQSFQVKTKSSSAINLISLISQIFFLPRANICRITAALVSAISRAIKKSLGRDKKFRLTAWEFIRSKRFSPFSTIAKFTFLRHLPGRSSHQTPLEFVPRWILRVPNTWIPRENCRKVAIFLKSRARFVLTWTR